MSQEIKLISNAHERQYYEPLSDLYSLLIATEGLERAYIRDAVSANDYTTACLKLIAQYKTVMNLVTKDDSGFDITLFIKQYKIVCPAAIKRLIDIGVPATVEHQVVEVKHGAKYVAETVQHFITLMDSLKLNLLAVDQLHPQLSDLIQSLHKVGSLPADYSGKDKIKDWLIKLNKLKASDEISTDDARQLLFDLESSYAEFQNSLSAN